MDVYEGRNLTLLAGNVQAEIQTNEKRINTSHTPNKQTK